MDIKETARSIYNAIFPTMEGLKHREAIETIVLGILEAKLAPSVLPNPDGGSLLDVAREIICTNEEWESRPVCSYGRYIVGRLHTLDDLKTLFPKGEADANNWCFFGCSGVHGSYEGLLDVFEPDPYVDAKANLTVLVVQPRLIRMFFGYILVTPADMPYLQKLATTTQKAVFQSQYRSGYSQASLGIKPPIEPYPNITGLTKT